MTTLANSNKINNWLRGTLQPSNNLKPVTMSYDLIKDLQPKERAIIYQALLKFQDEAEQQLAISASENKNHAFRQPLEWLLRETKSIKSLLFSESFPEDLEPLQFFLAEQKGRDETIGIP